jgi:hypothetical protein
VSEIPLLRTPIRGLRRACSLLPPAAYVVIRLVGRRCACPPRLPARRSRDKLSRTQDTSGRPAAHHGLGGDPIARLVPTSALQHGPQSSLASASGRVWCEATAPLRSDVAAGVSPSADGPVLHPGARCAGATTRPKTGKRLQGRVSRSWGFRTRRGNSPSEGPMPHTLESALRIEGNGTQRFTDFCLTAPLARPLLFDLAGVSFPRLGSRGFGRAAKTSRFANSSGRRSGREQPCRSVF